jgi:hypothetical protein
MRPSREIDLCHLAGDGRLEHRRTDALRDLCTDQVGRIRSVATPYAPTRRTAVALARTTVWAAPVPCT